MEDMESLSKELSEEQLLKYFQLSLNLIRGLKITKESYNGYSQFGLFETCTERGGKKFIRTSLKGDNLYNSLSSMQNRGELFMQDGKWHFA